MKTLRQKGRIFILQLIFLGYALPVSSTTTNFAPEAQPVNDFAFDLYRQIGTTDQNLILSPYSLSSLLVILANGASGNTQRQLSQVLHFAAGNTDDPTELAKIDTELMPDSDCQGWLSCKFKHASKWFGFNQSSTFLIANSLWAEERLIYKTPFLAAMGQINHFYRVNFNKAPEAARQRINNWVEEKTDQYIKELIAPGMITGATQLILVNAIYFNGLWESPFKPEATEQKPFLLSDGNPIQTAMMGKLDNFFYSENERLQMLQLPYLKSTIRMAVLLPKTTHSVKEIQQTLTHETFSQLLQNAANLKVLVSLPKFKLASTFNSLKQPLQQMGVIDAFSDNADFSNMTTSALAISDIIQKAVIEVDEKGTVAAAATAVVMFGSAVQQPMQFNADHPFLFILYDTQSGVILFIGQVFNPQKE
ncbi:serpin family protein [Legionella feeleii]|uniref:Serine protease inhibitor n=1 Tax=Legionella feeleii TaxID=453 RepID=A0A0W0TMA7_9GAMM|nr:serpin family protein [Legionella feeleii]KTC96357.1 Serpin (serine protease inhibitor) [Legionella feeleii]SPX62525.1 Serine protease inhibitor [Legionella feeleii]